MKILVINGPNLNMLGIREPALYGREDYQSLCRKIEERARELGVETEIYRSNHEGDIVDRIQAAYFEKIDGIIINPAAYTHTSVAILDALKAVAIPAVEVHLTDISSREEFRRRSFISAACIKTIVGRGTDGYCDALEHLKEALK